MRPRAQVPAQDLARRRHRQRIDEDNIPRRDMGGDARPHARVALGPDAEFDLDRRLAQVGHARRVGLQASDFDSLVRLISGTPFIATLPKHLSLCSFCTLDWIEAPLAKQPLSLMLFWHARHKVSDRHNYWRQRLFALASRLPDVNKLRG